MSKTVAVALAVVLSAWACGASSTTSLAPISVTGDLPLPASLVAGAYGAMSGALQGRAIVLASGTGRSTCGDLAALAFALEIGVVGNTDFHLPLPVGEYPVRGANPSPDGGNQSSVSLSTAVVGLAEETRASTGHVSITDSRNGTIVGTFQATWSLKDGGTISGSSSFAVPDCP